ncbi:hypothetical protein ABEV09_04055 [Schinkia azotoformans]|uniref:hypothetical protein n=1 Tax=Schinkia azotoformans TaxID=1454 RepID=UPI002DB7BA39|nr:hypothetical protein [Schinkia azotoformans]MEC1714766.1 hypothetical protein [Schinkia azotoformans]
MSRFKQVLSDGKLNDVFRDDLSENFNKADAELTRLENESKTRDETIGKAIASKESESIGRDDDLQEDVDSKNSQAHARMTQIEQESITRDNEHKNSTSAHPAENITYSGPINALTAKAAIEWVYTQLNNIIANAGKDNTEIVDGRLGADGIARATIGLLLREIHQEQLAANKKTEIVGHGTHILNQSGKTSSPVKVEFYGQTLVNLLGNGKFIDLNSDGVADGWNKGTQGSYSFSANAQRITALVTDTDTFIRRIDAKKVKYEAGKYYILVVNVKTSNAIALIRAYFDNGANNVQVALTSNGIAYVKFSPTVNSTNAEDIRLYNNAVLGSTGYVEFDSPRIYSVSSDLYNKIGVSLLDADVERMFPYVNSIGFVKNPFIQVEGVNLIGGFLTESRWSLHSNAKALNDETLELIATNSWQWTTIDVNVSPNTDYNLNIAHNGRFKVDMFSGNDTTVISSTPVTSGSNQTFKTLANVNRIRILLGNPSAGTFTFSQPMLNLGSTPKPFVPRNPSYLYADVTLAGNDNKKDILSYNEDKRRWEKTKWWMTDVVLDGSLGWALNSDKTGYKNVQIPTTSSAVLNTGNLIKYDGKVLLPRNFVDFNGGDFYLIQSGSPYIIVSLSDTDTGFTDAMTPSVDLIKSYFYCWFYRGDGTTHKWRPIGDTDDSRLTTVLPTSMAPTVAEGKVQPYKLTYQLATPVIEEVKVDGDLVVSGATQVMVGSEFTYTEDAVTKKRTYTITPTSQRTGANLLEVKATYDSNFKSSYDSTVGKVNNIAESLSVLDMQMYRVLLALKNNNITV